MKGIAYNKIWITIPTFAWRDWENHEISKSMHRCLEIWAWDLQNTKQKWHSAFFALYFCRVCRYCESV